MKKSVIILSLCAMPLALGAFTTLWLNQSNGLRLGMPLEMADSLYYDADGAPRLSTNADTTYAPGTALLRSITVGESTDVDTVFIAYDGEGVRVTNPHAFTGLSVEAEGAHVTVRSERDAETVYALSGTSESGSFKLYSAKKSTLIFDNLHLTADTGAAINVQSGKKLTVVLPEGSTSTLADGSKYNTLEGEDEKGCFFSEGQIIFTGTGSLSVTGNKKHAIASDDYVSIESGDITVPSAKSDAVHANDYVLVKGGSLTTRATTGDAIDSGAGYIEITGGTIDAELATADTKAVKADSVINMSGGLVKLNVSGAQAKGFSTKQTMTMTGGAIEGTLSGDAVVVDNDPSYCSLIKCKGSFVMEGGSIACTHTGLAGKGISTDGDAIFTGGTVEMTMSGGADVYVNADGDNDSYKSTCMKIDGNLQLLGGNFTLTNNGVAGKAINVDGTVEIGSPDYELTLTATTTGDPLSEGNSSGGWWGAPAEGPGGGWGPGGGGNAGDYTYPKVVKADGNLTVRGGHLTLHSTKEGGEGLESKQTLSIEGGEIDVTTYDDCINAANDIQISGGRLRCVSSNNDAIDSNGSIHISGGETIAVGAGTPECGLNCDNGTLAITGGTLVSMGGDTSTPTSSACTQPVIVYGASATSGTLISLTKADGTQILSLNPPKSMSSCRMVITSPELVKGDTYSLMSGGTLTGGDTWHELTTGAELSGGTQAQSVSISSMVTNVGSSGGWRP